MRLFFATTRKSNPCLERLVKAIEDKDLQGVKKCLQKNVDVNAQDSNGYTALHHACSTNHVEIVESLLNCWNIDVNAATHSGHTPLHLASCNGHYRTVRRLLQTGTVDANAQDENGRTALHLSLDKKVDYRVAHYLVDDGSVDGKLKDIYGETVLHVACKFGRMECVQLLMRVGAEAILEEKRNDGRTPLHLASYEDHLEVVKYLVIFCGAMTEVKDNLGLTPQELATKMGNSSLGGFLKNVPKNRPNSNQNAECASHQPMQSNNIFNGVSTNNQDELKQMINGLHQRFQSLEGKLDKNHMEAMEFMKGIKSSVQQSLRGLAYLATESVKKCPTLVWMVPVDPRIGRTPKAWVKWAKRATSRRYYVYFVCQHSFTEVDLEPRIEIEVPRAWMVQVAPILRLSLFAIRAALYVSSSLPFPVPHLLRKDQISLYDHFINSFLDDTTMKLLEQFELACNNGNQLSQRQGSRLLTLTGPAYEAIEKKATEVERMHWKKHMEAVFYHGSLIWVKKEYTHVYLNEA